MGDIGAELVERARALQPLVREHAAAAEAARTLQAPVVRALADAGLFRIAVPRDLGGFEADPASQVRAIEAIAEADGSTGWTLMIGIESLGFASTALRPDLVAELLAANPGVVFAGAINPLGRALPCDGGYRVSGRWPFASGCLHSDWFWGQCVVHDGAGPARGPQGFPLLREVLVPVGEFRVLDTWHVAGLQGSGSHDVEISEVFVPERATSAIAERTYPTGALYRIPLFGRVAYNKVGVATGIARGALDHFAALCQEKVPRGSSRPLRERALAQSSAAHAEAELRSARAFVWSALDAVWQTALAGGVPARRERALLQLACTHAVSASVRAVELVHRAAGTSANFRSSPLERCFRDVHVVPQHVTVSPVFYEVAGRALLGLDPGTPFF